MRQGQPHRQLAIAVTKHNACFMVASRLDRWLVAEMLPGSHPLEELEAVLLSIAVNPPEHLINQLREDERGLLRATGETAPQRTSSSPESSHHNLPEP